MLLQVQGRRSLLADESQRWCRRLFAATSSAGTTELQSLGLMRTGDCMNVATRLLVGAVAFLLAGCAHTAPEGASLDGTRVALQGRWNAYSKEEAQIICASEPRIVDVINIGNRSTPAQDRRVKVVSILHWREMTPEQTKWMHDNMVQGIPAGYIIEWPEANWEYTDKQ